MKLIKQNIIQNKDSISFFNQCGIKFISADKVKEIVQEVAAEYKGSWIPCSERLPEEIESMFAKFKGTDKWDTAMFKKISDDVNVTVEYENGTRKTMTLHTNDGKWNTKYRLANYKVIAWQPLPEPYKN